MNAAVLREIGKAGTFLEYEALSPVDYKARTARDLCDHVGAKSLDDLVECAGDRRERGKLFAIKPCDGLPAFDWLAVALDTPRREVALQVGKGFVRLDRDGMDEITQNESARDGCNWRSADLYGFDERKRGRLLLPPYAALQNAEGWETFDAHRPQPKLRLMAGAVTSMTDRIPRSS